MSSVHQPSARLLRLLSLLEARPTWTGADLAGRLGVTTRTIRRDVDRLRGLGYPVDAAPGPDGGYRLGVGGRLPPLLLDDDEAAAVAIALGAAAGASIAGIEESALAALSKLDRVLPEHLRGRVAALRSSTVQLDRRPQREPVEVGTLVVLAHACADRVRVRIDYCDREGRRSERRVEPYRLVSTGRRWYLVGRDVDREAWRTLRVDRIEACEATGHRFVLVEPPDAAGLVTEALAVAPYRYTARVRVAAPLADVTPLVPAATARLEPDGPRHTLLTTGSDDVATIAAHLLMLDLDLEVLEPPELIEYLRRVVSRVRY